MSILFYCLFFLRIAAAMIPVAATARIIQASGWFRSPVLAEVTGALDDPPELPLLSFFLSSGFVSILVSLQTIA